MKTIQSILELSINFLKDRRIENPRKNAEHLLSHALKMKRVELYMYHDRPLEEADLEPFRKALKRKSQGEPLEHVLGEIEFYNCTLNVSSDALIPRQETEILLDKLPENLEGRALDLCTGSGCLAIGLKKAHPHLEVTAVELSSQALELARANAKKNDVEIVFLEGDLTKPLKEQKFDLILCNPPYISEEEYQTLDPGVRDFEPKMALVSGKTGFEFFERLSQELPQILNPGAKVFFEMGTGQGDRLLQIFSNKNWRDSKVEPDWAGHDRFFSSIFLENE